MCRDAAPAASISLCSVLYGVAVCACGNSPEIVGGSAISPGNVPEGRAVAEYELRDCRDAAGAPAARVSRVLVIEKAGGKRVLVELRKGYPSLVVENSFNEGGSQVFQAAIEAGSGDVVVHDFRLPVHAGAPGRVSAAPRWKQVKLPNDGFHAYLEAPALVCQLVARASVATSGAAAKSGS